MEAWLFATYGYWAFPAPDEMTQSRFGWAFSEGDLKNGLSPDHNNAYKTADIHTFSKRYPGEAGHLHVEPQPLPGSRHLPVAYLVHGPPPFLQAAVQPVSGAPASLPSLGYSDDCHACGICISLCLFLSPLHALFLLLPFLPEGKYGRTKWADTVMVKRKPIQNSMLSEGPKNDGYTHWKD